MHAILESLVNKVNKFDLNHGWNVEGWHFNEFNRLFPGILDRIEFIVIPATIRDMDDIMDWLMKHSISGKQKILDLTFHLDDQEQELTVALINRIKEVLTYYCLRMRYLCKIKLKICT